MSGKLNQHLCFNLLTSHPQVFSEQGHLLGVSVGGLRQGGTITLSDTPYGLRGVELLYLFGETMDGGLSRHKAGHELDEEGEGRGGDGWNGKGGRDRRKWKGGGDGGEAGRRRGKWRGGGDGERRGGDGREEMRKGWNGRERRKKKVEGRGKDEEMGGGGGGGGEREKRIMNTSLPPLLRGGRDYSS